MLDYSQLPDTQLFKKLTEFDDQAYTTIYQRYSGALLTLANKIAPNEAAAKALVQDTFVALYLSRGKMDTSIPLLPYLFVVQKNQFLNGKRTFKKRSDNLAKFASHLTAAGSHTDDSNLQLKLLLDEFDRQVALLPPKMREIFDMSHKQCLSNEEIAARLQISETTVKKQISNANIRLRAAITRYSAYLVWIHL